MLGISEMLRYYCIKILTKCIRKDKMSNPGTYSVYHIRIQHGKEGQGGTGVVRNPAQRESTSASSPEHKLHISI